MGAATGAPIARGAPSSRPNDNWPHTRRPLPWLLAAFLVMDFLIPFDGIIFKVHVGVDSKLDRFLLVAMIGVLILKKVAGSTKRTRRTTAVELAVATFAGVAVLSVVVNIDRIYQLNQLSFTEKSLSRLLAYVAFFFVVVATVRAAEMVAFARLILVLACLTALGTLYEAHTGFNVFYVWAAKLLSPIATVLPSVTAIHPTNGGRPTIVGPTAHGLALTGLLTIALPFAVLPLLEARSTGKRLLYLVVIGLILAAELATARKTAMIAPLAMFAVLAAYKRQLLRWAPLALIALVPIVHFAAPGALGSGGDLLATGSSSNSTEGRLNDYSAVAPDILDNLVIGRGYGTLDPQNWRWYRILDNEYLGELVQVGIVGLLAYLAMVIAALTTAHGVIKRGGVRAPPALAAAAGCAAFGVLSATYDATGFPQAPYTFLFAAGLIAVSASDPVEPQRARVISLMEARHRAHPTLVTAGRAGSPRLRTVRLQADPRDHGGGGTPGVHG